MPLYCKYCNAKPSELRSHVQRTHPSIFGYLDRHSGKIGEAFENRAVESWELKRHQEFERELSNRGYGQKPTKNRIHDTAPTTNLKAYKFISDNVHFRDREFVIEIREGSGFQAFRVRDCPQSKECLNKIKKEFFAKWSGNKLYKCTVLDQKVILEQSPGVKEIIFLLDRLVEYYDFKYNAKKSRFASSKLLDRLSNQQIINIFRPGLDKSVYLNYLVSLHKEDIKIIPIYEFIGNRNEESFIFQIEANGRLFAIWENVNDSRASYIFRIKSQGMLSNLLSYIVGPEEAKREYLRRQINHEWAVSSLGYCRYIDHKGIADYKATLASALHQHRF